MSRAELVDRARRFAVKMHGGQRYGAHAYACHLSAVAAVLADHGFTADSWQAAAWLHDTIEDTPANYADLAKRFGKEVAALVHAVSGYGPTRADRTASIYAKLRILPTACILKLADRIANVEASADAPELAAMYAREQKGFAEVVQPWVPEPMWVRLERAIAASPDKTLRARAAGIEVQEIR